jgi:uncharacterized membrane protein YqjE
VAIRYAEGSTSLRDLATRLIADFRRLAEQHVALLKAELTQEATRLAKATGVLVAGTVAVALGALFLLVALGLWIGDLIDSTPGGLAIVGAILAVAGAVAGLLAVKELQRRKFERASAELRRDAEWIRNGA